MKSVNTIDIPNSPGVYKFLNQNKNIIYVGKSKNLKKRVKSYFRKRLDNNKIIKMVKETEKIEFDITCSEHDALLLENNLIKENKPKYNVLLRDDKTFPYIAITKERFPRIYTTRKINLEKEEVFGPYTNVKSMRNILKLIKSLYKIRNCNLKLTEKNIEQKKFKVCLEYHIGNCKGGCEGYQKEENYQNDIEEIKSIIKGKNLELLKSLNKRMKSLSKNLEFEKAQNIKDRIFELESFTSKSIIVNHKLNDIDVFGIVDDEKYYYINYMKINGGIIIGSETFKTKKTIENKFTELRQIIFNTKKRYNSISNQIISNIPLYKIIPDGVKCHVPKYGDKNKLIEMSIKNVLFYKKNLYNEKKERKTKKLSILIDLKNKLKLKNIPFQIDCFDISNTQGKNTAASLVTFKDGYPHKKKYRKFKIRCINESPDDYASIREVIIRHYSKILSNNLNLPDLIIIDGGKGQLSSACKELKKLKLYNKINIIGIAKKLEEIYFPNDSIPILLNKKSAHLKLIQQIRNEAHRFAISYHKDLRSKTFLDSKIESIKGIGEKTRIKLLNHFGSLNNLQKSKEKDIIKLIGNKKAENIINFFKR